MTLGGLALAVGMLVDEGTVTLENIFFHLEQGKPVEPAILDGAQQIVVPAFVTLLVLDIVFAPMFQLGGVAGYLFRPLAEAVVFALIGSFILSRTLVPTMARYFLHAHTGHDEAHAASTRHSRNPLKRFQSGFERIFTIVTQPLPRAPCRRPGLPQDRDRRLYCDRGLFLRAVAVPRREFLSCGRFRADPDARARPSLARALRKRRACSIHRTDRPAHHPARTTRQHRRQYRIAVFRHQHGVSEHRNDRPRGRRCVDQP